ncbi:MAG TPA: hypothetical protein PK129_14155 [Cellvibrionaceae bacterium]|nr:hypothetical protein [Cellvibrionaceae bacterium]
MLLDLNACKSHSTNSQNPPTPIPPKPNQNSTYSFDAQGLSTEGRYLTNTDHSVTLASAASNVSFMAAGSKLEFLASAEFERAFIDVLVDGQLIQKAYGLDHKINTVSINLGDGAKDTHLVEIYNRGEGDGAATRLTRLDTEQPLIPLAKPTRKLMFIGASVTCGAASEPADNCALSPASHNGRVAHGTLIAHALNAESQLVCRSGRGILNGSVASIPQDAVHFLDYTLTTANGPVYWDHRLFTPDGILIALGNNDDLSNGEQFISAYNTLLYKLRSLYPEALIILTEGPLISGERKNQLTAHLASIVSASNDAKLSYIPSKKYPNSPCNDHPDAKTHQAIAEELLPLIKEKLKW